MLSSDSDKFGIDLFLTRVKLATLFSIIGWSLYLNISTAQASSAPSTLEPQSEFVPSNARTEDGLLIPVEEFFPASRCVGCHRDTHQAWSESLHRNAAREPFYRESADILLKTRGMWTSLRRYQIQFTRINRKLSAVARLPLATEPLVCTKKPT